MFLSVEKWQPIIIRKRAINETFSLPMNRKSKRHGLLVNLYCIHVILWKESEEQSGISQLNRKVSDVKTST